jgi:hypothetical protein
LTHWKALRAFFRPGFLRSTILGSRVSIPSFFSGGRKEGSYSCKARAMPWRNARV